MKDVYLNLDFPPTVNSYYGQNKRGIKYVTKKGKAFKKACAELCVQQNAYGLSLQERLHVDVILYPPDRRIRDLDNYIKALFDSLTAANVWLDDEQVDSFTPYRGVVIPKGRVSLRIAEHNGFILPDNEDIWNFID